MKIWIFVCNNWFNNQNNWKKSKYVDRGLFDIIRNIRSIRVRNMLTDRGIIRSGKRAMRVERRSKRAVINIDDMGQNY